MCHEAISTDSGFTRISKTSFPHSGGAWDQPNKMMTAFDIIRDEYNARYLAGVKKHGK